MLQNLMGFSSSKSSMAASKPLLLLMFIIFSFTMTTTSLPFVFFHGIGDSCDSEGTTSFIETLIYGSGAQGTCIEIGNGVWDSFFMAPLTRQVDIACQKVKSMSELSGGYNLVGVSQGNIIARGLIEFCDEAPPVKNYISIAAPQAGISAPPLCDEFDTCELQTELLKLGIYNWLVQASFAPAGYIKIPTDIDAYLKGSKFLPKLNNELVGSRNSTYKERFASLHNLVLILCEEDRVIVPKESSWFGFVKDGTNDTILPVQETNLYIEDWIGLRTLDEAGKVKFVSVPGGHTEVSLSEIQKYIIPYLEDQEGSSKQSKTAEKYWMQFSEVGLMAEQEQL